MKNKVLASGNEAVAMAAKDCGVTLGAGYPGTPSTEILENFSALGGNAEWSPNEKCAMEVGIGNAFACGRSLVTMKHVGLNVAADPLFTVAYSGTPGGLVVVSADDPGMASSQNEQDNRRYAIAAGIPMLEPTDAQECYDFLIRAFEISEQFRRPVLFRMTTRVCHSKCVLQRKGTESRPQPPDFIKDPVRSVMIPAYARKAHRRLRESMHRLEELNESGEFILKTMKSADLGIIASGIAYQHALDAAPDASIMRLGMTYPLPMRAIREFAASVKRCVVVEEGDPVMFEAIRAAGIPAEGKDEMFRFGELNVGRVRRLLANDLTPEPQPKPGVPPQLCPGCPHRKTYEVLKELDCIVSGDIGCYTLGVLPPFEALHICACMGASITMALGMRKNLPEQKARKVVSVIGDSTFMHTGINGIVEMCYNRPATGHVVLILDNSTTAMTGLQEHPGTGRKLDHTPAPAPICPETVVKAIGVDNCDIVDQVTEQDKLRELLKKRLASNDLSVIICRHPCVLAAIKIREYQNREGK